MTILRLIDHIATKIDKGSLAVGVFYRKLLVLFVIVFGMQLLKGHSGAELHIYFLVHLESIYYEIFFYSKIVPNCAVAK